MNNGFIYPLFDFLIKKAKYLNIVELFKYVGDNISDKDNVKFSRIAVDVFIISKWILIIVLWLLHWNNKFISFTIWYLIISNVYTYFFYHIWKDDAISSSVMDETRLRRRFLNLILAIIYSNLCFAYLYRFPYSNEFNWSLGTIKGNPIIYSISNSIAGNYDVVRPISDFGNFLSVLQLILTFFFVAIIISRSIPQKS